MAKSKDSHGKTRTREPVRISKAQRQSIRPSVPSKPASLILSCPPTNHRRNAHRNISLRTFCCEEHEGLTGYAGSVKVGSDGAIAGVHSGRFIRDTPGVLHLAMHHSMRFGSNQERIEICPTDNFRGLTPPNVTTHAFDFKPIGNVRCGHRALSRSRPEPEGAQLS